MCQRTAELSGFNRSWDAYEGLRVPHLDVMGPRSQRLPPLSKDEHGEGPGRFRLTCAGQMYLTFKCPRNTAGMLVSCDVTYE